MPCKIIADKIMPIDKKRLKFISTYGILYIHLQPDSEI